jgi:hypothetical protein
MRIHHQDVILQDASKLKSKPMPALLAFGCGLAMVSASAVASAQACIPFTSSNEYTQTNLAGTASPFMWQYTNTSGALVSAAAYDDHNTNTLMVGDLNAPHATGIGINTGGGLGDVTATYFNGTNYLAFLSSSLGTMAITTSSDSINWSSPYALTISGAGGLNFLYTPVLQAYNGKIYVAYVQGSGQSERVYLGSSTDGHNWTQIGAVSSIAPRSRPSMTVYSGNLWMGFTSQGVSGISTAGAPYVGVVVSGSTFAPNLLQQGGTWGNSNHSGVFAGILILPVSVGGQKLYVIGQGTASSQNLYETGSASGNGMPAGTNCSIQLRYTPTGFTNSGLTSIDFQGDHDTGVWYATQ